MTEGNAEPTINDEPIFAAELTPYRSLGWRGFRILLMIAGALSLVHIFVFLVIGAWPIGREGRTRFAGVAHWDASGAVCAAGRALWIELRG